MGGMKDEAKRITIPPLFPRVHVNDTGRGGLSQQFDGKTMSLVSSKRPNLPSPTNNISDSLSTFSLSLPPPPNNARLVSPFNSLIQLSWFCVSADLYTRMVTMHI